MGCCPTDTGDCSAEALFKIRVQQLLNCLRGQYPSLFVLADFWRQMVVSPDPDVYADQETQSWVRLGENVEVFVLEKNERFHDSVVGIVNQRKKFILAPELFDLVAGDHAIIMGTSYLLSEITSQAGVTRALLVPEKSSFINPSRGTPTYRVLGLKARIL